VCKNSDQVQSYATSADDGGLLSMFNVCPMCDQQFDTADELQLHVNTHFDEEQQAAGSEYAYFYFLLSEWSRLPRAEAISVQPNAHHADQ